MKKIIIIGTLHGMTPESELEELFNKYKPEQILVEIAEADLEKDKIKSYPREMVFAYKWAKKNGIPTAGFDSGINSLRDGATEKDNQKLIEVETELLEGLTWKDMNRRENDTLLDTDFYFQVVDPNKERKREEEMLKNIQNLSIEDKIVMIITGAGHLKFFEKNIPAAIFPLR